ncbi:MAG: DUF1501 domain-containing protein [Planctomycetes bacterium]|nr:DUF1501 domain-containing protein [Planctomycetota bacterium]
MSEYYKNNSPAVSRREFNEFVVAGAISAATTTQLDAAPQGRAEACVLLWLGGGMCHVDTFDPKTVGDPKANKTGSAYPSIPTVIPGVQVCEHLARTAKLLDRGVLLRTLNHPLKVDHADSANLVKTGRLTSGTIVYPSLGSLVVHQLGRRADDIPPYIVMGSPNVTRGPGFLGSRYGYLYLTDVDAGPTGLKRPSDVSQQRQGRRQDLLDLLRVKARANAAEDPTTRDYDATLDDARALMNGSFAKIFDLTGEPDAARNRYGSPFGQRCLLARRLVESGVRFVEVAYDLNFKNGTGWDTHRHGQKNQHLLIEDLDQALSALVEDLEQRKLLDTTLIVVATEFGRPPDFDGQGGRGHQSAAFSAAMFGGGLRAGKIIGATDELGRRVAEHPVTIPDFHATILATLGIDPATELYDGDRPIPITDHGTAIHELFA